MSRKYSQRGYQEDDSRPKRTGQASSARPRKQGPGGRGLGAPRQSTFRCAECGALQESLEVSVGDRCGACEEALHNCLNCRHFDSSARFECRQEIDRRLPSKRRPNECDLFATKLTAEQAKESTRQAPSEGKSAFDALFKGI